MSCCELNSHALWKTRRLTSKYIVIVVMYFITGVCIMHCSPFSTTTIFRGIYTVRCMHIFRLYMCDYIKSNESVSFHNTGSHVLWKKPRRLSPRYSCCVVFLGICIMQCLPLSRIARLSGFHIMQCMPFSRMKTVTLSQITFTFILKCKHFRVGRQCRDVVFWYTSPSIYHFNFFIYGNHMGTPLKLGRLCQTPLPHPQMLQRSSYPYLALVPLSDQRCFVKRRKDGRQRNQPNPCRAHIPCR